MNNIKIYFDGLLFKILNKGYDFIKKYNFSYSSNTMISLIIALTLSLFLSTSSDAQSNKNLNNISQFEVKVSTNNMIKVSSNLNHNLLDTTLLKQANKLVQINENFYILDYLSGTLIQLKRCGGIDFFECEPINSKQQEILKKSYSKIDLEKRPIIVIGNTNAIAATMEFDITRNNVKIYFLNSSTQNKINIMRQIDSDLKQKILK